MNSIRRRVTVSALVATIIALVAGSLGIYAALEASLLAEFDAGSALLARSLASMTEASRSRGRLTYRARIAESWSSGAYLIRGMDGTQIAASAEADLPAGTAHLENGIITTFTPDGRHVRAGTWVLPVGDDSEDHARQRPNQPPPPLITVTVTVVRSIVGVDALLTRLAWIITGVTGGVCALTVTVTVWSMGRALAPLQHLAQRINALKDDSLGKQLDAPAVRELVPVVERLNQLFARLEESFANEKALNAALAHELRTPLAGLLTTIEVCLARDRDGDAYREALVTCRRIVSQMRAMAERLMLLSRLESGLYVIQAQAVDVSELVQDAWGSYAASAIERNLNMDPTIQPRVLTRTDPDLLRIVLTNLFDNAVSHTPKGGRLQVQVRQIAQTIEILVRNSGCSLSDTDVRTVFARFWRGDQGRDDTGRHCGLGLSLCQRVLSALGGTVTATVDDGWFSATVRVPTREFDTDEVGGIDERRFIQDR